MNRTAMCNKKGKNKQAASKKIKKFKELKAALAGKKEKKVVQ